MSVEINKRPIGGLRVCAAPNHELKEACLGRIFRSRAVIIVAASVLVIVAIGAGVLFLWAMQQPEARTQPIATAMQIVQAMLALLAVVLVIEFGYFAVKQVELARATLEQYRTDRRNDQSAHDVRVLAALLDELSHNRLTALAREGRLRMREPLPPDTHFAFTQSVYDSLRAGPLWTLSCGNNVWPAIQDAYWQISRLEAALHQEEAWQVLLQGLVGILVVKQEQARIKDFVSGVVALLGRYVAIAVIKTLSVKFQGTATKTRTSIETAIETINSVIGNPPINWDAIDSQLPSEFKVLPLASSTPVERFIYRCLTLASRSARRAS